MLRRTLICTVLFGTFAVPLQAKTAATAKEPLSEAVPPPQAKADAPETRTELPVPRFVTTRSASVNVRTGPGERYPLKWVLKKKGVPVEVIAEYDIWRKVRDWEGTEGWVHKAMLSGRRTVVIYPNKAILRADTNPGSKPVAELSAGVITNIEGCKGDWCELKVDKLDGYVRRAELWGVYPDETIK